MRMACLVLAVLAALSCGSSYAQEEAGPYRTALSVVGGLSVGSDRSLRLSDGRGGFGGPGAGSGVAVGGGLAHDFSPRLTLEANGLYLDRGSSAWSADAGLRLNLVPSGESIVPYFAVSGGVYGERSQRLVSTAPGRDDDDRRTLPVPPPRGATPGRNGSPLPTARPTGGATDRTATAVATRSSRSTDGMTTLGGGVLFSAGPHVFVRPDARAQVLFSGNTRLLGLFTINFGYRF